MPNLWDDIYLGSYECKMIFSSEVFKTYSKVTVNEKSSYNIQIIFFHVISSEVFRWAQHICTILHLMFGHHSKPHLSVSIPCSVCYFYTMCSWLCALIQHCNERWRNCVRLPRGRDEMIQQDRRDLRIKQFRCVTNNGKKFII